MHAWRFRLHQDGMTVLPERFDQSPRRDEIEPGFDVIIFPVRHLFGLRAVDPQLLVAVDDLVSGQGRHPLDVVEGRIFRVTEYHDIATLWLVDVDQLEIDDRQAYAVRELVDQDEIPYQQGRQHRAGGNLERLDQERPQQEYHQDHRKEAFRVFDPPRLGAARTTPPPQPVVIEQP